MLLKYICFCTNIMRLIINKLNDQLKRKRTRQTNAYQISAGFVRVHRFKLFVQFIFWFGLDAILLSYFRHLILNLLTSCTTVYLIFYLVCIKRLSMWLVCISANYSFVKDRVSYKQANIISNVNVLYCPDCHNYYAKH